MTTVRVQSGEDLEELQGLLFTHPGIFATPKSTLQDGEWQVIPNTFLVAAEASVPPGAYEVRAVGIFGISNARSFRIESHPVLAESEANNDWTQAQPLLQGQIVYGGINAPADVDCFRFAARKGQRLVVDCTAQQIDSRLHPLLTLADGTRRPLKLSEAAPTWDALVVFDVPKDGDYLLRIEDTSLRGGGEYGYRLCVHTGPHIGFAWPPAGLAGSRGSFTLFGFNLPAGQQTGLLSQGVPLESLETEIDIPEEAWPGGLTSISAGIDQFPFQLTADAQQSNIISVGVSRLTPELEREPNDQPTQAHEVKVPTEVAARFEKPRDVDVFTFEASAGEDIWIEVIGQRGGTGIDPYVTVDQVTIAENGTETVTRLTTQDDTTQNLAPAVFDTATDDPIFPLHVPATATYRLTLQDRYSEHRGDPSRTYRLCIRRAQPDFRLVAIPAGQTSGQTWPLALRRGDAFAMDVLLFRRDGFSGPVALHARRLPYGVTCSPQLIPGDSSSVTLVFIASEEAQPGAVPIEIVGTATLDNEGHPLDVSRTARAGSVVWNRNGNTPAISRTGEALWLSVTDELAPFQVQANASAITVHQGRQLLIPVTVAKRETFDESVAVSSGIPKNTKIESADLKIAKGVSQQVLRYFVSPATPPGTYLVTPTAEAQVPFRRNPRRALQLKGVLDERSQQARQASEQRDRLVQLAKEAADRFQAAVDEFKSTQTTLKEIQGRKATLASCERESQLALEQAQAKSAEALTAAKESQRIAEQAQQAAESSDDAAVAARRDEARQAVLDAEGRSQEADALTDRTLRAFDELKAQLQQVADELSVAEGTLSAVQSKRDAAQLLKERSDRAAQAAAAVAQQAEESRKSAEQAFNKAENAAKSKNIKVVQPLTPWAITVRPAPVAIKLEPTALTLKRGETAEVRVVMTRQNEFAGPCTVTLVAPDGVAGISSQVVSVAEDQGEAMLKVTAAADAPAGDLPHVVVQTKVDFEGEAIVDAALGLKIDTP